MQGCDRGVIWCLYDDFSELFPLNYLNVHRLILILDQNFKCWGVNFIIVTAGLMEVLLDVELKSNCLFFYNNYLLHYKLLDFSCALHLQVCMQSDSTDRT